MDKIRINNYNNSEKRITGCGALEVNAGESTTCSNTYGSGITEYPQSTTGNITGIFDMSGGVYEDVMGVFANSNGYLFSGNSTSYNSGFNGMLNNNGNYIEYTQGISFPLETKYYDKYQASSGVTISSLTACNGGICYGHALFEVKSWYGDSADFVSDFYPWLGRSNGGNRGIVTGTFFFNSSFGNAHSTYGFRTVLSQ